MLKLLRYTILLSAPALLIACAKTPPPAPIAAEHLCQSWRHQTIKKADRLTEDTAAQIEGSNKARPEWGCDYGHNRAKGQGHG